jgi:hypothetical protein
VSPSGKAVDFDSAIRRFESCHPSYGMYLIDEERILETRDVNVQFTKCWLTRILLLERLFDYQYPFRHPDLFETESIKLNKDQYLVRFEFIRVFSSKNATKISYLREFFQQHSVSNKRIRDIKRVFIELIQEFCQFRLIDSKVKLMLHSDYTYIEDLTTSNISDGFILYEKIVSK